MFFLNIMSTMGSLLLISHRTMTPGYSGSLVSARNI